MAQENDEVMMPLADVHRDALALLIEVHATQQVHTEVLAVLLAKAKEEDIDEQRKKINKRIDEVIEGIKGQIYDPYIQSPKPE